MLLLIIEKLLTALEKIIKLYIDGNVLRVIHNTYAKAKSCVKVNNVLSDTFSSVIGVRQGENLSPILFSIFLIAPDRKNDQKKCIY